MHSMAHSSVHEQERTEGGFAIHGQMFTRRVAYEIGRVVYKIGRVV